MDWETVAEGIDAELAGEADRAGRATRIAELIRGAGGYRWVGAPRPTRRS
jgi:hypothetical protein